MKVSIVIPCYNERATIEEVVKAIRAGPVQDIEIIVVDDGSTDGTKELLEQKPPGWVDSVILQERNQGKGAALRRGFQTATGELVLVQDADLEYDPEDYPRLLRPILNGRSKVVYGSRFIGEHKAMYFWHSLGNRFVTLLTNVLYDTTLTDMETCYKVATADVMKRVRLTSPRWGFDPEMTAKILKTGNRIYEVPISYTGREFEEGKKISWRDAFVVMATLIRCRFLP